MDTYQRSATIWAVEAKVCDVYVKKYAFLNVTYLYL